MKILVVIVRIVLQCVFMCYGMLRSEVGEAVFDGKAEGESKAGANEQ
jgi:hypothetical protein